MAKDYAKRFGSLMLAGVFLITTVGFTALIFLQTKQQDENAEVQQAINEAVAQQQLQENLPDAGACDISTPVSADAEAVPEAYIPEGDVTELEIIDVKVGSGEPSKQGDCLVVKYNGTLASNGEQFDGNFDQNSALQFPLGAGTVIAGWDQGMVGMQVGGTRRLVIPSELGYGESGGGSIPPNADLVFEVKLLEIK